MGKVINNKLSNELIDTLINVINEGNNTAVKELSEDLKAVIIEEDEIPELDQSLNLLQNLRDKRHFLELKTIGDALVQSGEENPTINRLYAQGLIDSGDLTPARYILNGVLSTVNIGEIEYAEAKGLLGRLDKQIFVNQKNSRTALANKSLLSAIDIYAELYQQSPKKNLWHGINTVALKARAVLEGFTPKDKSDYKIIAQTIIKEIDNQKKVGTWDTAILSEAYLALNNGEKALKWCDEFADDESVSAFHIGSFTRQLREVWKINSSSEPGSYLLPKLQHAMLHKEGGTVLVENLSNITNSAKSILEKTLGNTGLIEAEWIERLIANASSVARIGKNSSIGIGTGFVLRGEDIKNQWKGKTLILTNYHVIYSNGQPGGMLWKNLVITLYGTKKTHRIKSILWESPPSPCVMGCPNENHLDVVIAELDGTLDIDVSYNISRHLPIVEKNETQKVYLIGHPNGGNLAYSMQDNKLLDHEAPLIHYHAPTEPGNSGSPIFNEELELIGIHHAGSFEAPMLNGKKNPKTKDRYPANEGIWIQSIIEKVRKE